MTSFQNGDKAPCPICGSATSFYSTKTTPEGTWRVHRCPACGYGFIENRPTLEFLARYYSSRGDSAPADHKPHPEQRADCRALAARIGRLSADRGRSLDIGCGSGGFSYHLAKNGYRPTMIDLDPNSARNTALIPGSDYFQCGFDEFTDKGPFAAILMSQVLEHAWDPMAWLRHAAELLTPDGLLAVAVPNFAGVYRLMGGGNPMISPPSHLNFFSPNSLRVAFEKAGLRLVAMDSISNISFHETGKPLSFKRKVIEKIWNTLSVPLNVTPYGIILRGYAKLAGRN